MSRKKLTDNTAEISMTGSFFFNSSDRIYAVHFPGNPAVPGSVIIQAFLTAARKSGLFNGCALERFRFREFVSPGEYRFSLCGTAEKAECRLYRNQTLMATGILKK